MQRAARFLRVSAARPLAVAAPVRVANATATATSRRPLHYLSIKSTATPRVSTY
jgi:hypothetical protein